MNDLWLPLAVGMCLALGSVLSIPYGFYYWGFRVPEWGVAILFITGLALIWLSIRGMLRGHGKPRETYTNQEVEKAKENLEKMYMQEHGTTPVPGGEEKNSRKAAGLEEWYDRVTREK